MATPTITDYLKYANLQMAAEAFLYDEVAKQVVSGQDLIDALQTGNNHALIFTQTQAQAFTDPAKGWTVVDQSANTSSGFSGTLFRNNATNELVISFRSTEFIDDAIRDSMATNTLEIFDTGFAWGQLADMEDWYAAVKSKIPTGAKIDVTGYSLGGHLATAFNLLHQNELNGGQVVTFNGAGVGKVNAGSTLAGALNYFTTLRSDPAQIKAQLFSLPELATLYDSLKPRLDFAGKTTEQAKAATEAAILDVQNLLLAAPLPDEIQQARLDAEKRPLLKALNDMLAMQNEALRIKGYIAGGSGADAATSPQEVLPEKILAETLDYRLAVGLVAQRTTSSGLAGEIYRHIDGNKVPGGNLSNQFDVVGTETTTPVWSAVANSQWHYGTDVKVFIEDQPLTRGGIAEAVVKDLFDQGAIKLLQNQYGLNNFADTHSLVLIVDTLNVQNTLKSLDTSIEPGTLKSLLQAASARQAKWETGTQGKAEGDVLEWVVDTLAFALTGNDPELRNENAANGQSLNIGGTWADKTLREKFYTQLDLIQKAIADNQLAGKLKVTVANADLATAARTDFAAFLSLYGGFPLGLKSATGQEDAVSAILGGKQGGDLYGNWSADKDLTPAERAAGKAYYSDQYLTDRAAYLASLVAANTGNTGEDKALWLTTPSADPIYYKDIASGISIETEKGNRAGRQYLFGGAGMAPLYKGISRSFSEMLRSTGKNTQKRNPTSPWRSAQAANDVGWRQAA